MNKSEKKSNLKEIKECPICKGPSSLKTFQRTDNWVECNYCHLQTDFYVTPEIAIESWNNRIE